MYTNKDILNHLNLKIEDIKKITEAQEKDKVELDLDNMALYFSQKTNSSYLKGYLKALEDLRKEIDKFRIE